MVLFCGTAQTINSMVGHHDPLSQGGGLLHYELRGQGRTTTLPLTKCSLEQHVDDFQKVLQHLENTHADFADQGKVDLCGFSFGGRVALAIAANLPDRVRRVVATGVPADRGATGRVVLRAWESSLEAGNLQSFLWQSLADGHSDAFLAQHESRLEGWVNSAADANECQAIAALVGQVEPLPAHGPCHTDEPDCDHAIFTLQTHTDDESSPWHTLSLARKAAINGLGSEDALFLVGNQDRIATPEQCTALANVGGWECRVVEGSGHSVPIEQPRKWREAVLSHLRKS